MSRRTRRRWLALLCILVPAGIGIAMRLWTLGGPPYTDGGTYQYNTWLAREGLGSVPTGPVNFYAWLASWVGFDANAPYFRVRVLDAFLGGAGAGAFAWFLRPHVGAVTGMLLASLWAALTVPTLINDAGYKNPIAAAWLFAFVALGCVTHRRRRGVFLAGVLVVAACLLREAFAPLALLVPMLAAFVEGRRAAGRCVLGLAAGTVAGLGWMSMAAIDPFEALQNLRAASTNAAELLRTTGRDPAVIRAAYFEGIVEYTGFLGVFLIVGLFALPRWRLARRGLAAVVVLAVLPLPEIYGKYCLPYHWFQLVPAVLLIGGLGFRQLHRWARRGHPEWRWPVAVSVWLGSAAAIGALSDRYLRGLRSALELHGMYRGVMIDGRWDDPIVERSRYLQIAHWLRENTGPDDTVLVSGYAYGLYVLADRRPASISVSDLTFSRMTRQAEAHPEWIEALRAKPPRVVIETRRWTEPVERVWPNFHEQYELMVEWPDDPAVHYGSFGARAWRMR